MNITIEKLLELIDSYNSEEVDIIRKAYEYAENFHSGQFRESGEPYITHPLNVAYILAEMHADRDTVCAGLLHDVIEDTTATKEDIAHEFNQNIANLVDGVTKLSKENFSSEQDESLANTRKIIIGITEDVRIIIIKLADRLHNMRTLQFKSELTQKKKALETMEIFVPLAYLIGAYRIKSELEDLSLLYLKPDKYKKVEEMRFRIEEDSKSCLQEILQKIQRLLLDNNISHEIKVRTKNIYGIYKKVFEENSKLSDIHDLLALKIMVDEIANCYLTLGIVHSQYPPINDKFKDYIYNPKTNMYRSLHTTVFGPNDRLVQTQIRTFNMDSVASFGLTTYWDINKGEARNTMQEDLKNKYQFFKSLVEINSMFADNQDFVNQVKAELFSDRVYTYTTKGEVIDLPKGSTPIDFAYKLNTDLGNIMIGAIVNDKPVQFDYILQNKDRVRILTDDLSYGPRPELLGKAYTSSAKKQINEFNKK